MCEIYILYKMESVDLNNDDFLNIEMLVNISFLFLI